jgi:hypothetical protein
LVEKDGKNSLGWKMDDVEQTCLPVGKAKSAFGGENG